MITPGLAILGIGITLLFLGIACVALLKRSAASLSVGAFVSTGSSVPLGLRNRGGETRPESPQPAPAALEVNGLSKTEAEEWLDWLEAQGYRNCELDYVESAGFRVRHKTTAA